MTKRMGWALTLATCLLVGLVGCKDRSPAEPTATATAVASTPTSTATATASATAAPDSEPTRPFLYRVKGAGETAGSGWLLGTVHIGADPDEDLHPVVWKRFGESDRVVIEADVGGIDPQKAAELTMLPEGQTLRDDLTEAQFEKLSDMAGFFVPDSALARMKPGFALALVVKEMLPDTPSMDRVIQQRAEKADKTLSYLETPEEQVALFDEAIGPDVLADTLDESEEMEKRLRSLSEAYLEGDEETLVESAFPDEEMKEHPEMFEKMYFERNEAWVKKIEPRLREGDVFIAVGAGHLVGERSVVSLLRERGWKVHRVSP